ncbi:hypothetical protein D3C76_1855270 [compost metagenome]
MVGLLDGELLLAAEPFERALDHAGAKVAGDLRGGIGGMRVDHDDLVAERQGGDAVADAVGLVERDNAS